MVRELCMQPAELSAARGISTLASQQRVAAAALQSSLSLPVTRVPNLPAAQPASRDTPSAAVPSLPRAVLLRPARRCVRGLQRVVAACITVLNCALLCCTAALRASRCKLSSQPACLQCKGTRQTLTECSAYNDNTCTW